MSEVVDWDQHESDLRANQAMPTDKHLDREAPCACGRVPTDAEDDTGLLVVLTVLSGLLLLAGLTAAIVYRLVT